MSDMNSMSRETKKQQLRQRIIRSGDAAPPRPVKGPVIEQEDDLEEALKKRRRHKQKIAAVILLVLIVFGIAGYFYLDQYQFQEYKVSWQQEMTEGGFAQYVSFGDNVLKYSKDGVSYIDAKGQEVWVQGYEIKTPIVAVKGDYAAIADQQGNAIYIFDKNGMLGQAATQLPILKVSISAKGLTAAILDDGNANIIAYYKKDGTDMKLDIRTTLAGDGGYPLDISLSPNSQLLMASFVYLNSGVMKNKVVFYNFSEVGKNVIDRLVGGFQDEYASKLAPRVEFLTDTYACVFADNSLDFYSLKDEMSPRMIVSQEQAEEIQSVFYCSEYAGCITGNTDGENAYTLQVYKNNGDKVFSVPFNYDYKHVDVDGNRVILYNENSCQIYNMNGHLKFSSEFDFSVSKIRSGRMANSLIITGPQIMKEIVLK